MPALAALDRGTRMFWRLRGRRVDLAGEHAWLRAPMPRTSAIGDAWLHDAADTLGGRVAKASGAGLIADMASLDGPGFRAADLHPNIREFYEHTSDWRMEVWTEWNPVFQPGGELISRVWAKRVQQLALPTRPLQVAGGMDSRVELILDARGEQLAAGWIRTLRTTGEYVYSGCYSTRRLPDERQPSVHVAFPLERGNVQVFLQPSVDVGGHLRLSSPSGQFGSNGAYVVVDEGGTYAARIPIHEEFRVYVDREGTLRTDHYLSLWGAHVVQLHYKLTRRASELTSRRSAGSECGGGGEPIARPRIQEQGDKSAL